MANRDFQQFQSSLEKGLVQLFCRVSVAGGGAVTLQKWNPATRTYTSAATTGAGSYAVGAQGIKTVTRTGTGAWTVVLQDSYQRLLGVRFSTTAASGVATVGGAAVDATTDVTSNSAPTILLVIYSTPGTPADPASGDKIDLRFTLQNSASV
jgi:hypothetical protein